MNVKTKAFTVFIVLHFSLILFVLLCSYFDFNSLRNTAEKYYVRPLFMQRWSMFAPNPPSSSRDIIVSFVNENKKSDWYSLKKQILSINRRSYFGTSQRLLKYFSGIVNDIISYSILKDGEQKVPVKETSGFKCIQAYISIFRKKIQSNLKFKPQIVKVIILENPIPEPKANDRKKLSDSNHLILKTQYKV